MIRIGMIGSESSHAEAFTSMINLADENTKKFRYPDFKVTAIYGENKELARELAQSFNLTAVNSIEEMPDIVDAVMIVLRDGNLHLSHALPFIKAGIPVWLDKPVTNKNEDCYQLLHAAKTYGTLVTGGSTCRYMEGVKLAKEFVRQPSRLGKPLGASMNYPADTQDEYGGFYFYAAHLCEMCLEIFGNDPISTVAIENGRNVSAIVKYSKYNITLNFLKDAPEHMLMIHGSNTTVWQELDSPILPYYNGFDQFAKMLIHKEMPLSYTELYVPVALVNAMIQSYTTKTEVAVQIPEYF